MLESDGEIFGQLDMPDLMNADIWVENSGFVIQLYFLCIRIH